MFRLLSVALLSSCTFVHGQQSCSNGSHLDGAVVDPSGAVIERATIRVGGEIVTATNADGEFHLDCVPRGTRVSVDAVGFESVTLNLKDLSKATTLPKIRLPIAQVQTAVEVSDDASSVDDTNESGTVDLSRQQIDQLPDDPDDLLSELQTIAASAGGSPLGTILTVNGFQNGSALPPKGSIASIRVNPDMFSAEYQTPLIRGGRIEITTKAGSAALHGALFTTISNSLFNARDPLSLSSTPAGKQRYGFELSGPLFGKNTDFATSLEERAVDEFNVVNAITLDANLNPTAFSQVVQAPQDLWIGSLRGDWQVTKADSATLSFETNVNHLDNQGIGGLVVAEAGYSSDVSEYDLHFINTQTLNARSVHETRIGYSWKRTRQTPNSTDASLQVAGFFTGGGSVNQALNDRERDLEIDDDVLFTRGRHALKFGEQSLALFEHNLIPNNFNGAFVFGGGSAPVLDSNGNATGQMTTITSAEQYRRARLALPGGLPTTYQVTSGNPRVAFTQWRVGLFLQDTIHLKPNIALDAGIRYQLQTTPDTFSNIQGRLGVSFGIGPRSSWIVHIRGGLFSESTDPSIINDVARLDGQHQQETTVYSPSFSSPLTPIPGSIRVGNQYHLAPVFYQHPLYQSNATVEHDFPHRWHAQAGFSMAGSWGDPRTVNINAPMVPDSVGLPPNPTAALLAPRPLAPGLNLYQYQNSGHERGRWFSSSLSQQASKWFNLRVSYRHLFVLESSDIPQSTYSSKGEAARPGWLHSDNVDLSGSFNLPQKVVLSTLFSAQSGNPYNITTGTDANGDGTFNDRPSFASGVGPGVYGTRYGLMTTSTVNGDVPYNSGRLPAQFQLSTHLSKVVPLNPSNKEHPRLLTLNARAANVLNHENVTTVGSIVSAPNFDRPLTAQQGRRIEFGARYSF